MKSFFCALIFFFVINAIHAQEVPSFRDREYEGLHYSDYYSGGVDYLTGGSFIFGEGGKVSSSYLYPPVHECTYSVIEEYGLHYLQIFRNDGWPDEKYLIIGYIEDGYFDFFMLYENNTPFFVSYYYGEKYYASNRYFPPDRLSATSVLREGGIVYSTDNLNSRLDICWAARGGVGEKIIIREYPDKIFHDIEEIHISTGFISFTRPYLYRQNSRPKKLRISFEGEDPKIVELADTYHLQALGISGYPGKNIWIEILEVYPGTRFNDTCINFLMHNDGR